MTECYMKRYVTSYHFTDYLSYTGLYYSYSQSVSCDFMAFPICNAGQDTCLQTNNNNHLPLFQGYGSGPSERIQHQHQAIIPSYKFNCCGNITAWGVDLNPVESDARFSFDFQVWRPSSTVANDGCYSLVANYLMENILPPQTTIEHVARVTPPPGNQLPFQPGDVLGFYVESSGTTSDHDNGVVLLNNDSFSNELIWHASITDLTSSSGSCPYPVGSSRILSSPTSAAPVISIAVTTYSCLQSIFTSMIPSLNPTHSLRLSTVSTSTLPPLNPIHSLRSSFFPVTVGQPQQTPTLISPSDSTSIPLPVAVIIGIVVAFILVCFIVATLVLIIVAVAKRNRIKVQTFEQSETKTGIVLENQVYGESVLKL